MAKKILIVDDEIDICEILRFNLEMEGYEVFTAEGPFEGEKIIKDQMVNGTLSNGTPLAPEQQLERKKCIDLILLDVMMTPKSGFEWAKELKADARTADIPIIFCTAKTMEEDLLHGFALGSDDYICKPFRISEVKARVKAVLRRTDNNINPPHRGNTDNHQLHFSSEGGDKEVVRNTNSRQLLFAPINRDEAGNAEGASMGLLLDLDRKECFVDGKEVAFTKLEFEVLALLLSKPGQVFSREKILQTVWPSDTIVLDRTVDVNITRIRKKIGRYGECLRTKFGYGYLFNA